LGGERLASGFDFNEVVEGITAAFLHKIVENRLVVGVIRVRK